MKLVSYNIRFGRGLDQKIDLGRITETVKHSDIIALQRVNRAWIDREAIGSDHKPYWVDLDF
jgi:endonuclease/exonuclease/phosphatase family metal-dependent hydrolase